MIYNNLPRILAVGAMTTAVAEPDPQAEDKRIELALAIDRTMRERAPAGWKGAGATPKKPYSGLMA